MLSVVATEHALIFVVGPIRTPDGIIGPLAVPGVRNLTAAGKGCSKEPLCMLSDKPICTR